LEREAVAVVVVEEEAAVEVVEVSTDC